MSSPRVPLRQKDVVERYRTPPSFTDLLPWTDYLPSSKCFLLEDGVSVGAFFELKPRATDALGPAELAELRDTLQIAITEVIPEEDPDPWVLQIYVQDDPDLQSLLNRLAAYPHADARDSAFTRYQLQSLRTHLAQWRNGSNTQGPNTEGRGICLRRVRAVLYRRQHRRHLAAGLAEAELEDVVLRFSAALAAAGVTLTRGNGEAFYRWLMPWFNPHPSATRGNAGALSHIASYPGDDALPIGPDFAESLVLGQPESRDGAWWFDQRPRRVLSLQQLRTAPTIGHLTAEQLRGDAYIALVDRLPISSVLALTITFTAQHRIRDRLGQIRQAAVGESAEAALTRDDVTAAERQSAAGNKLYPTDLALYLSGSDLADLSNKVTQASALLLANGLQPIAPGADLIAQDSYLRYLPMAYDPALEQQRRRSRLFFAQHIANMLPVYGRSVGTGRPGLVFLNRGAEPMCFDPLNREDRKKNAHSLILGPTGAGKSALLIYLIEQMLAHHRPRVFIIEAGGSFALFAKHLERHGLSVHQLSLQPDADVSLPPFADALALADAHPEARDNFERTGAASPGQGRDPLGEMEITARIMITGGDAREDARFTRADRVLIREAIVRAANTVQKSGRELVLTEDVVTALRSARHQRELPVARQHRAAEMADAMSLFCSGLAGQFFNRPGKAWPLTDVTVLDLGLLAREGYQDQLTVAYLSIMGHINGLVEAHQSDNRPTLVVTDEGHIITTNPLLAGYVVKITKMWRKLGAWFWIATQNLEDFPDASRRMLNMMEWWLCLVMPKEEVDQIGRFRDLSAEERRLLLSARKEPGRYTEGVVLSDSLTALFRNVPPAESLALAMTEKHEKAERAEIMRRTGVCELDAAYAVATRIRAEREARGRR